MSENQEENKQENMKSYMNAYEITTYFKHIYENMTIRTRKNNIIQYENNELAMNENQQEKSNRCENMISYMNKYS